MSLFSYNYFFCFLLSFSSLPSCLQSGEIGRVEMIEQASMSNWIVDFGWEPLLILLLMCTLLTTGHQPKVRCCNALDHQHLWLPSRYPWKPYGRLAYGHNGEKAPTSLQIAVGGNLPWYS